MCICSFPTFCFLQSDLAVAYTSLDATPSNRCAADLISIILPVHNVPRNAMRGIRKSKNLSGEENLRGSLLIHQTYRILKETPSETFKRFNPLLLDDRRSNRIYKKCPIGP